MSLMFYLGSEGSKLKSKDYMKLLISLYGSYCVCIMCILNDLFLISIDGFEDIRCSILADLSVYTTLYDQTCQRFCVFIVVLFIFAGPL